MLDLVNGLVRALTSPWWMVPSVLFLMIVYFRLLVLWRERKEKGDKSDS